GAVRGSSARLPGRHRPRRPPGDAGLARFGRRPPLRLARGRALRPDRHHRRSPPALRAGPPGLGAIGAGAVTGAPPDDARLIAFSPRPPPAAAATPAAPVGPSPVRPPRTLPPMPRPAGDNGQSRRRRLRAPWV